MLMTIMVKTDAQMGVMPIRLLTRQYHNPNLKSPFFLSLTGKSLSLSLPGIVPSSSYDFSIMPFFA